MARPSQSMSRGSLDATALEALSESSSGSLGSNVNSIAYLVYANRGDPYSAGYKAPTTRDIPQIKLPRVEHSTGYDISPYLQQMRSLEEAQSDGGSGVNDERATSESSDASRDSGITPLSAIPEPFFSEDFKLDNPRVFDAVIGDEDSNMIQEKLSWYVDIVEAHLAQEIARASTQFFAATAKFGAIEEQAAQTSQRILDFSKVTGNQQKVVDHYMETEQLQQKLRDATTLCDSLSVLVELKSSVERLEEIAQKSSSSPEGAGMNVSSIKECLEYLDYAKKLADSQEKLDISRVIAAQPLIERIEIVENHLKSRAISQYVSSMIAELQAARIRLDTASGKDVEIAQRQEIAQRETTAREAAQVALDIAEKLDARKSALEQYRLEVDREVKYIIRGNVPMHNPGDQSTEESQALARSLHAMSAEDADNMCQKLFSELTSLFFALKDQQIPELGSVILDNVVRSADSRLARVLRVRKDPATTLNVQLFTKFYLGVTEFCDTCSIVTDGATEAVELSEFLVAQTKLYVHNLHALVETELGNALDTDDWRRAEITPQVQAAVDLIASLGLKDPNSWSVEPISDESDSRGTKQRVELESQIFLISKSTAHLVVDIIAYLQLVCSLPSHHAVGISVELIELLRMFNHKSHHLILGFGATKTAGLKHISVKNLVLCFESLRLVETLLQYIKKCIERHLPKSLETASLAAKGIASTSDRQPTPVVELLASFDTVQQAYFDHRAEIHLKLVKLMGDKVSAYSRQIAITDWSVPAPQANKYMLDLVRQTTTVAHIAQEMLPPSLSLKLIEEIYAVYKQKLLEAFSNVQVETVSEKRNVLRDLAYFRAKSEALKGAGNTGDVIYESVNGFVAPELTAEVTVSSSSRPSLDQPRTSMDDADATLAFEPEDEINDDHGHPHENVAHNKILESVSEVDATNNSSGEFNEEKAGAGQGGETAETKSVEQPDSERKIDSSMQQLGSSSSIDHTAQSTSVANGSPKAENSIPSTQIKSEASPESQKELQQNGDNAEDHDNQENGGTELKDSTHDQSVTEEQPVPNSAKVEEEQKEEPSMENNTSSQDVKDSNTSDLSGNPGDSNETSSEISKEDTVQNGEAASEEAAPKEGAADTNVKEQASNDVAQLRKDSETASDARPVTEPASEDKESSVDTNDSKPSDLPETKDEISAGPEELKSLEKNTDSDSNGEGINTSASNTSDTNAEEKNNIDAPVATTSTEQTPSQSKSKKKRANKRKNKKK